MSMRFEYMKQITSMDSIEVEDMGNVVLNVLNDEGQEWYLVIKTSLGWSTIKQIGPLVADVDVVPNFYQYTYQKVEYKETKLFKIIDNFINDPKKIITQIFFTNEDEVNERVSKLIEED